MSKEIKDLHFEPWKVLNRLCHLRSLAIRRRGGTGTCTGCEFWSTRFSENCLWRDIFEHDPSVWHREHQRPSQEEVKRLYILYRMGLIKGGGEKK